METNESVGQMPVQGKESAFKTVMAIANGKGAPAPVSDLPPPPASPVPPPDDEVYRELIRRLVIPGYQLLAGEADRVTINLTPEKYPAFLAANADKDIFLVGGVISEIGLTRASDAHIKKKNYFVIDIDVREFMKKEGTEIADEDIRDLGRWCAGALSNHPFLSEWSYIVFSGNGIHTWYIGDVDDIFAPENWKQGMKFILDQFEKHTKLVPDRSCVNVSKLIRVPGSYNNKHGRHVKVEILCAQ